MHANGHIDRFARSHEAVFDQVHGTSAFFPFHRRFVLEFENIGRSYDPGFTVPYWDAPLDYRRPERSPVLQRNTLGGNGRSSDGCLTSGVMANWGISVPTRHCLSRRFDNAPFINSWMPPEVVSSYIQSDSSLADFREHIEYGIHGNTHVGLGGDAATKYAAADFFFHMHHANIDRLWWLWQNNHARGMSMYNGIGSQGAASLNDVIPNGGGIGFGGERVGSVMVLGFNGVCYSYDSAPSPPRNFPASGPTQKGSHRNAMSQDGDDQERVRSRPPSAADTAEALPGDSDIPSHRFLSGASDPTGSDLEAIRMRASLDPDQLRAFYPGLVHVSRDGHQRTPAIVDDLSGDTRTALQAKIPYPALLSKDWVAMHGFDYAKVEQVHREACYLIELLNNSTYRSPY
ncbi:hypothetical protein FBU59_001134 [Linderina macrospora]|uniref:Uncharacterized protein n=1 Tax=Linderina macrospora TaxID=4868 RepID=A0ACC1JF58_9FUNG|nr:hypothetical protein FBU59_001134 [Linderina macrospora]